MAGITPGGHAGTIISDASGSWGCGAFTSTGDWFQVQLPGSWDPVHITAKELLPIVIGVALWGEQWQGSSVQCWCDNAAVVAILKTGWSRDERVMHLMRSLFFLLAIHNMTLVGSHIAGRQQMHCLGMMLQLSAHRSPQRSKNQQGSDTSSYRC